MKFLESKKKMVAVAIAGTAIGAIAISLIAGGVGYISKFVLGDDNAIEQAAEAVIENQTGMEVDLSPSDSNVKNGAKVSYRPQ